MKTKKRGFTLIELIVVIIIVGIISAVAMPMMTSIKAKAVSTEAITTLGVLKNAFRVVGLQDPNWGYGLGPVNNTGVLSKLGIASTALEGTYFDASSYYVIYTQSWPGSYLICYVRDGNTAPKRDEALAIRDNQAVWGYFKMFVNTGLIQQSNVSRSGYPSAE